MAAFPASPNPCHKNLRIQSSFKNKQPVPNGGGGGGPKNGTPPRIRNHRFPLQSNRPVFGKQGGKSKKKAQNLLFYAPGSPVALRKRAHCFGAELRQLNLLNPLKKTWHKSRWNPKAEIKSPQNAPHKKTLSWTVLKKLHLMHLMGLTNFFGIIPC